MVATYGQRQRVKNLENIFHSDEIHFNVFFFHRVNFVFSWVLMVFLLALAIFIIISMSIYWGFFEEWTIWTDYTMAWVEFNFFIYYWDRLTITRVYLAFIYMYGFVLLTSKII